MGMTNDYEHAVSLPTFLPHTYIFVAFSGVLFTTNSAFHCRCFVDVHTEEFGAKYFLFPMQIELGSTSVRIGRAIFSHRL